MPVMQVNDINMYYEVHGEGEPLVFVSGFSGDSTLWANVLDAFKQNYQVIVFDNRGAGRSDVPEGDYSIDQMADDVVALCKALNIKRANFIGSSMGGFILQNFAYRYPKLVNSAVMVGTTFVAHTTFCFYVEAQLELIKAEVLPEAVIKASCSWAFSYCFLSKPGVIDELIELQINNPHPFSTAGYQSQYAALKQFDSRGWVAKIDVPVLVLGGDQDLIFSEASVRALADKIPDAQYYSFKNCGHIPHLEYPDEFIKVVKAFLA